MKQARNSYASVGISAFYLTDETYQAVPSKVTKLIRKYSVKL